MLMTTPSLSELEMLMQQIPGFAPRGHGTKILQKHEYTVKDCDCAYCLFHSGRGEKAGCSLPRCLCLEERIQAGAATTEEILAAVMAAIHYPPFERRLGNHLKKSEGQLMDFQNEKHRLLFVKASEKAPRNNHAFLSAIYLLTADFGLWNSTKRSVERNEIHFDRIRPSGIHPYRYTLLCAAKDLYLGSKHLSVSDLADAELIPPRQFDLICTAMAIRRFGLGVLKIEKERKECSHA